MVGRVIVALPKVIGSNWLIISLVDSLFGVSTENMAFIVFLCVRCQVVRFTKSCCPLGPMFILAVFAHIVYRSNGGVGKPSTLRGERDQLCL